MFLKSTEQLLFIAVSINLLRRRGNGIVYAFYAKRQLKYVFQEFATETGL